MTQPNAPSNRRGLYSKYLVVKRDSDEIVRNCFVLRYDRDPAARAALHAYALHCVDTNPGLAADLLSEADEFEKRAQKRAETTAYVEMLSREGRLPEPEWER